MCFAVTDLQTVPAPTDNLSGGFVGRLYIVNIRVTSHSRVRTQAEGGLRGRLYSNGTFTEVSESAQKAYSAQHGESPKLTQKIAPGETILCTLVFEAPQGTTRSALTLDHRFTPGYFVIGESPFFHKPDIHQLPNDR